jgi:hypothetical protein
MHTGLPRTTGWALALTACAADLPSQPTFQDVMPIVAANCIRCHAYPPIGGAPGNCTTDANGVRWCGFRLDSYDDIILDDGDPADPTDDIGVRGATSVAAIIPSRVQDPRAPMPPRFPLDELERETLIAWSRGEPPARDPRPGNRAPAIELDAKPTSDAVALRYALHDPDGDLVVGTLRARGMGGEEHLITPLQSGRDEIAWDTSSVPAGVYTLSAWVDDGGGWLSLEAGSITVRTP